MDSTAQTAPRDSEIAIDTPSEGDALIRQPKQPLWTQMSSTKLQPLVAHGFDSANSPRDSNIINESAATGAALIRQRKQPKGLRNHQRNFYHG
jgi:hypothetical protein